MSSVLTRVFSVTGECAPNAIVQDRLCSPFIVVSINDHLASEYHRFQDFHHQNNFVYAEKEFSHLASLLLISRVKKHVI
jgi:hypothetical protein